MLPPNAILQIISLYNVPVPADSWNSWLSRLCKLFAKLHEIDRIARWLHDWENSRKMNAGNIFPCSFRSIIVTKRKMFCLAILEPYCGFLWLSAKVPLVFSSESEHWYFHNFKQYSFAIFSVLSSRLHSKAWWRAQPGSLPRAGQSEFGWNVGWWLIPGAKGCFGKTHLLWKAVAARLRKSFILTNFVNHDLR